MILFTAIFNSFQVIWVFQVLKDLLVTEARKVHRASQVSRGKSETRAKRVSEGTRGCPDLPGLAGRCLALRSEWPSPWCAA